ncbi:MAG: DUF2085 domain-containing protein [Gracilimonas sp.]
MKKLQANNKALYYSILMASGFLFYAALGPGLFDSTGSFTYTSWQYQVFDILCHQDELRSFDISGTQMAVCSRCISIYGFFFFGLLILPVYVWFNPITQKKEMGWLIVSILLNLIDVFGNYFEIWTNTHISRFLLGGAFGIALALFLKNEFFTLNKSE